MERLQLGKARTSLSLSVCHVASLLVDVYGLRNPKVLRGDITSEMLGSRL